MAPATDPEDTIHCLVYEGLCNRMNCVASAMATGRKTILSWAVNQHCPVEFGAIFANIDSLEISNEPMEQYRRSASPDRLLVATSASVSLENPRA